MSGVSGDERARFVTFADAAMPELLRYGLLLTGSRSDAEDLVQAALERVLRRWGSIDESRSPLAYCRVVMARLHVDSWRAFRRHEELIAEAAETARHNDPATQVISSVAVLRMLAALPRRQRTVVVLRYYADMSEDEIATAMKIARGTVKSQAAKALATLRQSSLADIAESP
jgi:RNA polymerase sigma-70 factor (sigma-E family)